MKSSDITSHKTNFNNASTVFASIVAILAISVLYGWFVNSVTLTQVHPDFAPMQFNTALCFLLSALGIGALSRYQSNISKLVTVVVIIISGVTVAEYIFDMNLGIDQLFVDVDSQTKTSHAGRMSPNTTLCFLLTALAMISFSYKKLMLSLAFAVLFIAGLTVFSYFYSFENMYGLGALQRMAIHTSAGFCLISFAIISYVFARQDKAIFHSLPSIIFIIGLSLTLMITQSARETFHESNRLHFDNLVADSITEIESRFEQYEQALWGGLGLFNASKSVERDEWQAYVEAMNIDQVLTGINGVGYIDYVLAENMPDYLEKTRADNAPAFQNFPETDFKDKFIIKYIEPIYRNKEAVGLDIGFEANRREAAERARDHGHIALTKKIELVQDAQRTAGFLVLLPHYQGGVIPETIEERQERFLGWVYAPFIARSFLKGISDISKSELQFKIFDRSGLHDDYLIYDYIEDSWDQKPDFHTYSKARLGSGRDVWAIEWKPSSKFKPPYSEQSALITLVIGFFVSATIAGVFYLISQLYGGATQNLRDNEERLRLAIEGGGLGFWNWDIKTDKLNYSDGCLAQLGYKPGELDLTSETLSELVHPHDYARVKRELDNYISGFSDVYKSEFRMRHKDGSWRWIFSRGRIFTRSEDQYPLMAVGTHADVTDRHQYEEKIITAKEEAERANNSKSDFLANMSHEIRTPMNGVLGTADLMSETTLNDKQRKYLNIIKKSGQTLLEILNEILDFSKIEAGKFKIQTAPMHLNQAVEELVSLLHPLAKEKGLDFNLNYEPDVPPYIIGDEIRIKQILTNLIGNAIKFTDKGQIDIIIKQASEKGMLEFSIHDTGVGIPQDQLDSIFGSFMQVESKAKQKIQGTGLGLAICKYLVEEMGGQIDVSSQEGIGSTFHFTIRYDIPNDEQVAKFEQEQREDFIEHQDFKANILAVEDVATNQFVITDMLETLGCTVDIANNGQEAVEMVQSNKYDLVLMDCQMPVMDGFDATRKLRELGYKDLPIIALTANTFESDKEACFKAGMDDFIPKPVKKNNIIDAFRKWLDSKV